MILSRGVRLGLALAAATGPLALSARADTVVPPSDLARDIRILDGKQVRVTGTLGQIRTHISKKGARSYSFQVSDERGAIAVLASTPPACRPGARVTAQGIVDGRSRRVDAANVACL